ncbi:WD repeat-containing protein 27-like [Styela clava]
MHVLFYLFRMTTINIIKHYHTQRLVKNQIAFDNEYFAYVHEKDILLNKVRHGYPEHIKLSGHHSSVTALCIGTNDDGTYLVSAGSHYIILWDVCEIEKCFTSGNPVRGRIITDLKNNAPMNLTISKNCSRICVVLCNEFLIYNIKDASIIFSLSNDTDSEVSFLSEKLIVCCFSGVKLEIWDIEESLQVWTSSMFKSSISYLIASNNILTVACSNNVIKCFGIKNNVEEFSCQERFKVDLDKELFHHNLVEQLQESNNNIHTRIISVFMAECKKIADDIDTIEYKLICATSQALCIIDYLTQEVEVLHIRDFDLDSLITAHFCQIDGDSVFCLAVPMFDQKIISMDIAFNTKNDGYQEDVITILPKSPITDGSILKKELVPVNSTQKPKNSKQSSVTFHTKIKSSGYNKKPQCQQMFKPNTSFSAKSRKTPKSVTRPHVTHDIPCCVTDWSIPLKEPKCVSIGTCNINHISLSECNQYLACSFPDNSATLLNRKTKNHLSTLCGHNGPILGSYWNHSSTFLLTYSADCSARMWKTDQPGNSVLDLSLINGNLSKKVDKIPKIVTQAQFYYVDKFIILTFGNSIGLYSYYIDESPKSDVKRYLERNKYKLVKLFTDSDCQSITCSTAPNNIYSYVVLTCGSDKTVQIYDMNTSSSIACLKNVHTRPVSQIVLNTGSSFIQPENYNLFTTSAPTDGIKLWDIRSMKCVMKYHSHSSTSICPFDVSPCGKFIVTSGDDDCIYIYDTRSTLLQVTSKQKDKITSVSFSKNGKSIMAGLRNANLVTFDTIC